MLKAFLTVESKELRCPSSLKPNHDKQEPGVNGSLPRRDCVPERILKTLNSRICMGFQIALLSINQPTSSPIVINRSVQLILAYITFD